MAITKTNFINYIRCPRYIVLDKIKKDQLDVLPTYEDYKKEEEESIIEELKASMFDEDGNDLVDIKNAQLEIMMPYYSKVESLAGALAPNYFNGTFVYSDQTKEQESFDAKIDGIRYLCYVDIYNEDNEFVNIIEVKATTTNKFLSIGQNKKNEFGDKVTNSIFIKDGGIYKLLEDIGPIDEEYISLKSYNAGKEKLFNKFNSAGHYVYDLAIQRYIIENDLKNTGRTEQIKNFKFYLAVLNHEYVFDGSYEFGEPIYKKDESGNDIICYFDLTSITDSYMDKIEIDRKRISDFIHNMDASYYPIGEHCENKKTTKCKFVPVCWNKIPQYNSILNYIDNHHGFKDELGNKYDRYDLINDGIIKMEDMPLNYLNREKNIIQRNTVINNEPYINKEKIKVGIESLVYPIYHLDFETFPCPLPRFNKEKSYMQSVFQFSLHVEKYPGICDKEKDHYEYLAKTTEDEREELVKKLCEYIGDEGTVLVYNESFEKARLKELAEIFPKYKTKLLKIRSNIFDLMYIIKSNSKFYQTLGYDEETSKMFNYYHSKMSGSFSIKKILPLFSNLNYKDLEIGNGMEALIAYASYNSLTDVEYKRVIENLIKYCRQDTWAMFEILNGLKKEVLM